MAQQNFEVQRYLDQIYVARQSGGLPKLQKGQVLLQILVCGICGTDIRAATGNKIIAGTPGSYITLGHEGVGRVIAINSTSTQIERGSYVAILPHVHLPGDTSCQTVTIHPACIGNGHTLHMGWDIDGCFTNFMVLPITNVVPIAQQHLNEVMRKTPQSGVALFALTEPMLCVLSAYALIAKHLSSLRQKQLTPGRALVIGCGPIGILHSLILLQKGFEVWCTDLSERRTTLAQWCLNGRVQILHPQQQQEIFDLVMVTASSAEAIRMGERQVRDGGTLYLFAGMNAADYTATDHDHLFLYERLHRVTKGVLTTIHVDQEEKQVLYLGHSGYFEQLAPAAIEAIATHATALDGAITGFIPGFSSKHIISRLPGGVDWTSEDGSPAIIALLKGLDLRDRHCKLVILANSL